LNLTNRFSTKLNEIQNGQHWQIILAEKV
jgi:hypothetical protein